jgi:hypothetical protein
MINITGKRIMVEPAVKPPTSPPKNLYFRFLNSLQLDYTRKQNAGMAVQETQLKLPIDFPANKRYD